MLKPNTFKLITGNPLMGIVAKAILIRSMKLKMDFQRF